MWMMMAMALAADHVNHFEDVDPTGPDVAVGVSDTWARDTEAKVKVHLVNDTKDFLFARFDLMRLDLGGKPIGPVKDSIKVIKPHGKGAKVLEFSSEGMHVESGTFLADGLFLIPADSPVTQLPDFRLPMATKSFKAGDFSCALAGKAKQETDVTQAKFKCRYLGDGLVIVDSSVIQVRLADGQLFGNNAGGLEPKVVKPNKDFTLKVKFQISAKITDMQFAELQVQFNDAVRVGQPKPIDARKVDLVFSPEKTAKANK